MRLAGAEPLTSYTAGPLTGVPAVTRNSYGTGTAWYVATHPDATTLAALLDRIRGEAGVSPVRSTPADVEAVVRSGAEADYLFLINHGDSDAEVPVTPGAVELLTGKAAGETVTVSAGGVAVVREAR